jgi:hypothetical protein
MSVDDQMSVTGFLAVGFGMAVLVLSGDSRDAITWVVAAVPAIGWIVGWAAWLLGDAE